MAECGLEESGSTLVVFRDGGPGESATAGCCCPRGSQMQMTRAIALSSLGARDRPRPRYIPGPAPAVVVLALDSVVFHPFCLFCSDLHFSAHHSIYSVIIQTPNRTQSYLPLSPRYMVQ